jgi:hypothetical protein
MADRALEVQFITERKTLLFLTASRLSLELRKLSGH